MGTAVNNLSKTCEGQDMKKVSDRTYLVDHPFAQQELLILRDKNTSSVRFRKGLVRVGRICGYELMRLLDKKPVVVTTPLGKCRGTVVAEKDIVILGVLRAAMPLVEGLLKAFPEARLGLVGARRIEKGSSRKFEIEMNYLKIPKMSRETVLIVADPMLATGSTIIQLWEGHLSKLGQKKTFFLSVLSSRYGVKALRKAAPSAEIVTLAVDKKLNSKGYIVPGLGDAGDRAFG